MKDLHELAPFSIAVALPAYRRTLVERLLQRLLQEQGRDQAAWYVSNTPEADVILRFPDDTDGDPSASLLAELRRPHGQVETVTIEWPWRPGSLLAGLQRVAGLLRNGAGDARDALAWQWLRRWSEVAAQAKGQLVELRLGGRVVALLDPRLGNWYAPDQALPGANQFLAALVRESYALELGPTLAPANLRPVSLKPLLWQLGLRAGGYGALPVLRQRGALRLKGWPYLAAGGPKVYAELIQQLRGGEVSAETLRQSGMAPTELVDGFLNACLVCDFFHGESAESVAAQPSRLTAPPRPAAVAVLHPPGNERAAIASIRRTLQASTR